MILWYDLLITVVVFPLSICNMLLMFHPYSMKDDDDFSELDTVIPECSAKEIKLVSEKPDLFMVCFISVCMGVSSYLCNKVYFISSVSFLS